jgi:hypothetical protein
MKDAHRLTYARFQRHTMSPRPTYIANLMMAEAATCPGAIVECGTWSGGTIAGIASLLGNTREYWLFDSFEGLPLMGTEDGQDAARWQAQPGDNSCTASEADARRAMVQSGATRYHIVKGWFRDTLPLAKFPEGIAYLRADGDWYESVYDTLDCLFPLVNPGGIISIDDYYTFEGCARAVHDYLSHNKRPERIEVANAAPAWELPPPPGSPDHAWGAAFLRKL